MINLYKMVSTNINTFIRATIAFTGKDITRVQRDEIYNIAKSQGQLNTSIASYSLIYFLRYIHY